MQKIYLDYNATSPLRPEALDAMRPYFSDIFGNPSSLHSFGFEAKGALEEARGNMAWILGAELPGEIIFASSGTEANNLALKGFAGQFQGGQIITSAIEHHSIVNTCRELEKKGFQVIYLKPSPEGIISLEDLEGAINEQTVLVSIMHANNEIGSIQPIKEIGEICRKRKIVFHTDATQTVGKLPINVREFNIGMLSLSAHKFGGPKGAGALYVRKDIALMSLLHGGSQERGRRAGTENTASIVGMSRALELSCGEMKKNQENWQKLREKLAGEIVEKIAKVKINGGENPLPNTLSVSFAGVSGESLALSLDAKGIAVATGSACDSSDLEPSHVLLSLGFSTEEAHSTIRFSFGEQTTEEDIEYVLAILPEAVGKLRL